jgi:His-Xaa-Ser system protein HxsD
VAAQKCYELSGEGELEIILSTKIYSLSAIKLTSLKYSDRFGVKISDLEDQKVRISFNFKGAFDESSQSAFYDEFLNDLLDQDLREVIFTKTEKVRNLILANAFSRTSLIEG